MTGQEVILDLLRYIGVTGFAAIDNDQVLNRPGVDNDDIRRAIAALNSGLQTIQKWGPQNLKYGERAAFYNDPSQLTLATVALEGQSATATTTPPAWMLGCSVLLEGDGDVNRIMDITGDTISLLRGFRGNTASNVGATVYADCATLNEEIGAVLEPVYGSPNLRLSPAKDLDDFQRFAQRCWRSMGAAVETTPNSQPGFPQLYYVERRRAGDLFLRVAPMPGSRFNATFQAKLRAERVDDSIVDTEGGDDPGYEFSSLHADDVESVLLPIARWRFFTHPALKDAEARIVVKAEYDDVMAALRSGTVLESVVKTERVEYI
jgi:hypothetical protein